MNNTFMVSGCKKILLVLILLTPLFSGLAQSEEKEKEKRPELSETIQARPKGVPKTVRYYRIEPDIVTNVMHSKKKSRYVSLRIELMTDGEENFKLISKHDPLLRDRIIVYLNALDFRLLRPGETRDKIKKDLLAILRQALKKRTGKTAIELVLITKIISE